METSVLIGIVFDLISAGIERKTLIAKIAGMESQGVSPTDVAIEIERMRDAALQDAEDAKPNGGL